MSHPDSPPDAKQEEPAHAAPAAAPEVEHFRALADDLPVMVWASSADGVRTQFNRAWSAFSGRGADQEARQGWVQGIHPDDQERVRRACDDAHRAQAEFVLEYRLRRVDGEYRYVLDTGTPRFASDGTFAGHTGACVDVTARRLVAARLAETSDQLEVLIEALPDAVLCKDAEGRWQWANEAARGLLGLDGAEWRGRTDFELAALRPAWAAAHRALHESDERAWGQGARCDSVDLLPDGNGLARYFEASRVVLRDAAGRPRGLVTLGRNATARRHAEEALRLAASVFESSPEGIMITDAHSRILRVNRSFTEITGFAPEDVLGRTPAVLASGRHGEDFYAGLWQALTLTGAWRGEIWNRRKSGEVYPEWLGIVAVKDEAGAVSRYVGTFSDITGKKQAEEQIRRLAFYDALTGLANRRLFEEELALAAQRSRHGDALILALLDLDGFRGVNAALGYALGDQVLNEAAGRVRAWLPEGGVAARWSADEFAVLLRASPGASAHDLALLLRGLRQALAQPYVSAGGLCLTASTGVSRFPDDGGDAAELARQAESALLAARARGPNGLCFAGDPGLVADC